MSFLIINQTHPLRRAAEQHVRDIFQAKYDARIHDFPATLAALTNADGALSCVAGIRDEPEAWFSSQYFDAPLQTVISEKIGEAIRATELVEVSGLASNGSFASFRLLQHIVGYARTRGKSWGFFTVTGPLRMVMKAACLPIIELGPAARARVANPEDWGTYYETDPWVCALPDRTVSPLNFMRSGQQIRPLAGVARQELTHA